MSTGELSRILDNRAQSLFEEGKFEDAISAASASVESARRVAMQDTSEMPILLEAVVIEAEILRHVGQFDDSAALYKEADELAKEYETDDVMRARVVMGQAICVDAAGQIRAAAKLYEDAIERLENLNPPDLEEAASLRNNLAMIYREEGLHDRAEEHYIRAINISERLYGKEDLTVASLYNNLAALYVNATHYSEALEIAKQSLEIREKLLSADSPELAQSLSNLGSIVYGQGDIEAAVDYFSKAASILESSNETDPEEYEVVVSNYIDLLNEAGRGEEATKVTKHARRVYNRLNTAEE